MSAEELEGKAVAQRRVIVRGSLTLDTEIKKDWAKVNRSTEKRRIWFDGSQYRSDTLHRFQDASQQRRIVCLPCDPDGQYLR